MSPHIHTVISIKPRPKIGEFFHNYTEQIISTLYTLFQRTEKSGTLPNTFYEDGMKLKSSRLILPVDI